MLNNHHSPSQQYKADQFRTISQFQASSRLSGFRTNIRDLQLRRLKSHIREDLLNIKLLNQMVEQVPRSSHETYEWAEGILRLYNQIINFRMNPVQTLQVFWMAQKFPNRYTLQLLELVILKADIQAIDDVFQYDIMKLLHGAIATQSKNNRTQNNNRLANDLGKQVVVCPQMTEKIKDGFDYNDCYLQRLQVVRSALRTISYICQKAKHTRNFVVLSHSSFKHWMKAQKQFGKDIQTELYACLSNSTLFPFVHNEEAYDKISSRIIKIIAEHNWDLLTLDNLDIRASEISLIFDALSNLIAMKCSWLMRKIEVCEDTIKKSLLDLAKELVQQFSCLLINNHNMVSQSLSNLLVSTLNFIATYQDYLYELTSTTINLTNFRITLDFQLVSILRQGFNMPLLDKPKNLIYFLLGNHFTDKSIPIETNYALFMFDHNNINRNLLSLLAHSLPLQFQNCSFQIASFINLTFSHVNIQILEPLVMESGILQAIGWSIVEGSFEQQNAVSSKNILIKAMITLIQKLDAQNHQRGQRYKRTISDQFRHKLINIANFSFTSSRLVFYIDSLLHCISSQ